MRKAETMGAGFFLFSAARYLFGDKISKPYRFLYILVCFLGTQIELDVAWTIKDGLANRPDRLFF